MHSVKRGGGCKKRLLNAKGVKRKERPDKEREITELYVGKMRERKREKEREVLNIQQNR